MKLKIVRLDHDGYNGRDFFAQESDIGTTVLIMGLDVQVSNDDGEYLGSALEGGEVQFKYIGATDDVKPISEEHLEYMWTCLTADGRTVQMMAHEVEVAQ